MPIHGLSSEKIIPGLEAQSAFGLHADSASLPSKPVHGDSCGDPQVTGFTYPEHDLRPVNFADTNQFFEVGFDLNYDFNNSSDPPFHLEISPVPSSATAGEASDMTRPISTSTEPSKFAGSDLSSSTPPDPSDASYSSISSASSPYAGLMPARSSTQLDIAPPAYKAISRAHATTCKNCSRVFTSNALLKRHLKTHDRFACYVDTCTKTFTVAKDRDRHLNTMHAGNISQPIKLYSCNKCHHQDKRKDNLKRHMKTHEDKFISKPETG
ncbi:hypothetical protein MMC21_008409 [Puttea exsequens]|nr:hypothetical protein [Puttea exsequens]